MRVGQGGGTSKRRKNGAGIRNMCVRQEGLKFYRGMEGKGLNLREVDGQKAEEMK